MYLPLLDERILNPGAQHLVSSPRTEDQRVKHRARRRHDPGGPLRGRRGHQALQELDGRRQRLQHPPDDDEAVLRRRHGLQVAEVLRVQVGLVYDLQQLDERVVDLAVREHVRGAEEEAAGEPVQLGDLLDRRDVVDGEQVVEPRGGPPGVVLVERPPEDRRPPLLERKVEGRSAAEDRGVLVLLEDVALETIV